LPSGRRLAYLLWRYRYDVEARVRVQIQKWGNSLALRIPKPFAEEVEVHEGTVVHLSLAEGKLVAVPEVKERFTLKQLLRKVTKDNLHKEVDFGGPAEREIW